MKKIHIIYNPQAGKNHRLDELALALLMRGMAVSIFPTQKKGDAEAEALKQSQLQEMDALVSFGGDGTLNEIVNGVLKSGKRIPVAAYSAGTVNDFTTFLEVPTEPEEFADMLVDFTVHPTDVGKINDRYFINVFSCGVVSTVAHKTDRQLKAVLGSMAYYIEGLREIITQGLSGRQIYLKSERYLYNGEYYLCLISNSSSIGGFTKMAPKASVNDGRLNCLMIKKAPMTEMIDIVTKLLQGKHITNDYVTYFETRKIRVETEDEFDVDGEYFPSGPIEIEVIPGSFDMIYPTSDSISAD